MEPKKQTESPGQNTVNHQDKEERYGRSNEAYHKSSKRNLNKVGQPCDNEGKDGSVAAESGWIHGKGTSDGWLPALADMGLDVGCQPGWDGV